MIEALKNNLTFIREYEQHKLFCNGEGEIVDICKFTVRPIYRDCPYCKRLARIKAQKELQKNGSEG